MKHKIKIEERHIALRKLILKWIQEDNENEFENIEIEKVAFREPDIHEEIEQNKN